MIVISLLNQIIKEIGEDSERTSPSDFRRGIPTLQKDYYRTASPMLKERFLYFGSWFNATHGDWLNICEMESFWSNKITDNRMSEIVHSIYASINNWENDAGSLFSAHRVTVFAASQFTFERIYLIWFDGIIEPEIWVYDCNGESRYEHLVSYLKAYLDDDLSTVNKKWKLAEMG